jgi:hypothetical protein
MIEKQITLPSMSPDTLEEFKAYLPYCAEGMVSFKVDGGEQLKVDCASERHLPAIESSAGKLVDALCGTGEAEPVEKKVVFDNRSAICRNQKEIFAELLEHGHLIRFGEGQYGMGKTFLQVFKYFERTCYRLALQQNPVEYVYPIMIPTSYLRQSGYFSDPPQSATFMAPLQPSKARDGEHVGKPAVCLHCYPHFENQTITDPVTMTTQGRCYRYGRDMENFENLWEFIMRESIYLGSPDFVRERLSDIRRLVEAWMVRLGINCWIETAEDPFFADRPKALKISRLIKDSKLELRCGLPKGSVAVASFNFHGPHFSKAFNITHGGSYAATGCAGFGIERLTYAFLSQYGLDSWPRHIQDEVLAKP